MPLQPRLPVRFRKSSGQFKTERCRNGSRTINAPDMDEATGAVFIIELFCGPRAVRMPDGESKPLPKRYGPPSGYSPGWMKRGWCSMRAEQILAAMRQLFMEKNYYPTISEVSEATERFGARIPRSAVGRYMKRMEEWGKIVRRPGVGPNCNRPYWLPGKEISRAFGEDDRTVV